MAGVLMVTVFVVTSACWIQCTLGSCPAGKFGDSCSYSCHCGHSCNQETGVCGGDCDEGWLGGHGGTCQKENIAYKRRVTSSGEYYSHWAPDKVLDGNRDQNVLNNSCFHSRGDPPSVWTVDLGHQYRIHYVRIYHRTGYVDRIQTAVLSLSNSSSSTPGVPCYTFPSNTARGNSVYDVICDGRGQYFTITHRTETLNICEVEIYVCSQGSFGEECNRFCHCSDGLCDRVSGICAGDCRPGWQGQNCSIECDQDHYGANRNEICEKRKCSVDVSSCDRHTGSCDTGCIPGWTGVDCTQECSRSTYGQNCSKKCTERNCVSNSPCDHVTGLCVPGCKPGWKGIDCVEACDTEHYGANCDKACDSRHCNGSSYCNSSGECDGGCEAGWTLNDCTACGGEHFGANYDKACASRHCKESSSCNSTGDCDGGCEAGWTLNDCTVKDEEVKCLEGDGCNAGHLAVAVAVAFVVGGVVGAVVSSVVWWRRKRRPHKTFESPATNASNARTNQSQNSDDPGLESKTYDGLIADSLDTKMTGETYCTIMSGNTDSEAQTATSRNVSESDGAQMYETLQHTSNKMDSEYSEIGKPN